MTASPRAIARIHAVAGKHDISHDRLHLWSEYRGFESLKDMPDTDLDDLATYLTEHPEEGARFREKFGCVNAPSMLFTEEFYAEVDAAHQEYMRRKAYTT